MPDSGPSGITAIIEAVARAPITTVFITMLIATVVRLAALGLVRAAGGRQRFLQFVADLADAILYAGILVFMVVRPFVLQTFWIPSGSMEKTLLIQDYLIVNKMVYRTRDPQVNEIVVFRAPKEALNPGQPEGKTDFIKRCIGTPGQVVEIRVDPEQFDKFYLYRNGKRVYEPIRNPQDGISEPAESDGMKSQGYFLGSKVQGEYKLVDLRELKDERTRKVASELARSDTPDFVPLQKMGDVVISGAAQRPVGGLGLENDIPDLDVQLWDLPAAPLPPGCYLMCGDNRSFSSDGRFWGIAQRWRIIGRAEFVFLPVNRIGLAR